MLEAQPVEVGHELALEILDADRVVLEARVACWSLHSLSSSPWLCPSACRGRPAEPGDRVLLELSSPYDGHCHKVVTAVLQRP